MPQGYPLTSVGVNLSPLPSLACALTMLHRSKAARDVFRHLAVFLEPVVPFGEVAHAGWRPRNVKCETEGGAWRMRSRLFAVFVGMGRRTALAVVAGGLLLLVLSVLLQAGKQHRQYRDMQQQQLRHSAQQAALALRSRLATADEVLGWSVDHAPRDPDGGWETLRQQLQHDQGLFGSVVLLDADTGRSFSAGSRQFELTEREQDALEASHSVLLAPLNASGPGRLYLLHQLHEGAAPRRVLAELRQDWQLMPAGGDSAWHLAALDGRGQIYYSTRSVPPPIAVQSRERLASLGRGETVGNIAWSESGQAWVGAVTPITIAGATSDSGLVMVALAEGRSWLVAFWSALRTQATFVPLVLLAALLCYRIVSRQEQFLGQLRRAIGQMPERRVTVPVSSQMFEEVRLLAESCNRASEAIQQHNETRRVLDEIDGLLLPGGDYESVIDQVLGRVRAVTRSHNVGLTLVDHVTGHGRLFVVNATGGAPVTRVLLDDFMVATLREAELGLTVVRCEEGRHSFLQPLLGSGSTFFWVWPVMAAGDVAAILAVGYAEPPSGGTIIAETGTQCAQRLGLSLASNARAERLYRQAHFDPLTQLPNRLLFRDQLQSELLSVAQSGGSGALLYIDLDHFKRVNDSLGHEAGDQLLSIIAQRLRASVKEGDTVARLGGDEFTVILRDVYDAGEAAAVADRVINSLRKPIHLGGRDHLVRASIGIALFPAEGAGIDELLHNADLAMYRAKELGRGGAEFYNAKMGQRSADSGMFRALSRREFSLFFQPQYRVRDGSLAGIEALLRWQQPGGVLRTSAEFVPAAEESGLIVDLGAWVMEAACMQLSSWRDAGVNAPVLAVNLSVQQLRETQFASNLKRQLERHRLPPTAFTFEISEAVLTDEGSQQCIRELSELGVGLTLDDFGTGNTSLANLRRLPVQAVKIDRSFVEKVVGDDAAAALASTIIVMAHSLNKAVIAEGVETVEQLDYLREHGCDLAQGYFMARPLSSADMTAMLLGQFAAGDTVRAVAGA
jgi:diguanylate cyclase (GGDEF)-like protein